MKHTTLRSIVLLLATSIEAGALYSAVLRTWLLRWGCSVTEALPGDTLVAEPRYISTRSVTIAAPPATIWPWLVQIGRGRGGFYSYDWLENLIGADIHSADRILLQFQHLAVGDPVRLAPEGRFDLPPLQVAVVEVERALVLHTPGTREESFARGAPFATWAFVLEPVDDRTTRLIARWRSDYAPTLIGTLANQYLLEPIHFIMERRMLLGIKERVETTHLARPAEAASPPRCIARWLFRAPVWLYGWHLGWLLGHRFLLLTHRGRITGRQRQTLVEVVRYDPGTRESIVFAGWRGATDWDRNIRAAPASRVQTAREDYAPIQLFLAAEELSPELNDYGVREPAVGAQLSAASIVRSHELPAITLACNAALRWGKRRRPYPRRISA